MVILAIDPGSKKCGLAVFSKGQGVLCHGVFLLADFPGALRSWADEYQPQVIVVGGSTGSQKAARTVREILGREAVFIDEKYSSERAKKRYFIDHPPRGWRRLLPSGMLYPPEPFDDYAAVVLAEDYSKSLESNAKALGNDAKALGSDAKALGNDVVAPGSDAQP